LPQLLAFVNDLFGAIDKSPNRADAFRYDHRDRFPTPEATTPPPSDRPLGIVVGDTVVETARGVAAEIARLLREATVRDRATGVARQAQASDIAVLFRSRDRHRNSKRRSRPKEC
jgi:ATP-dependent exoDNAse (exonuclease V) beta subunit